ncbi:M20/M25/M40 family metallo-hydrolase [Thalassotalea maritima]|uniref:M20/M25/M40 family metallo-hydrolase n=1 Tax=Thalassotalea maritima TaxID=3242416 RepID=UPI003526F06F
MTTTRFSGAIRAIFPVFLLLLVAWFSITSQKPAEDAYASNKDSEFSTERAFVHLQQIAQKPHFVGTDEHTKVRDYLLLELRKLGLQAEVFSHVGGHFRHSYMAANTHNIIAKIPGKQSEHALALVSHYDSSLHSSPGASDAGSGVVTILEGIRTFLAKQQQPDNDIIIIITDAEERGLLGAKAVVNHHPWAKNIKVALNFEARGSGGPSYTLLETNAGNKKLVEAFAAADIQYPLANSLMYSVYKMLPNDTDLTIFREDGDIQGYNFAFIDDHFDYHTVNDSIDNLDKSSLNHQADYLQALVAYFAVADLSDFASEQDLVFFNVFNWTLISYPFSWVVPMLLLACGLWLWSTFVAVRRGKLYIADVAFGFTALLLSIISVAGLAFVSLSLLPTLWPAYAESPHNFTYNGHYIIGLFFSVSVILVISIYRLFINKVSLVALLMASIFVWLIVNGALALYLPGAGFLVIPVLFMLLLYLGLVHWQHTLTQSQIASIAVVLALPSVALLWPLITSLVVGLGLKSLVIACLLLALMMSLVLPGLIMAKSLALLQWLMVSVAAVTASMAIQAADYNVRQTKPSSINYLINSDSNKAYWFSSSKRLDSFTEQFFTQGSQQDWPEPLYPSYRRTKVTFFAEAKPINVEPAKVTVSHAEQTSSTITYDVQIEPQRDTNMFQLASLSAIDIVSVTINGQAITTGGNTIAKAQFMSKPAAMGMIMHYTLSEPRESVQLQLTIAKGGAGAMPVMPQLVLFSTSYDLYQQFPWVKPRGVGLMPEPFHVNDAVIIRQTLDVAHH